MTLATLAGGYAFLIVGGHTGRIELLGDLGPVVAGALVYLTVRTLLLQVVAAREAFQPDFTAGAGEAALGTAVALFATGHAWNLVALVPVALVVHVAYTRLARVRRETLLALETFANIVDERDPSTYQHSIRVARSVDRLARSLGLPSRTSTACAGPRGSTTSARSQWTRRSSVRKDGWTEPNGPRCGDIRGSRHG